MGSHPGQLYSSETRVCTSLYIRQSTGASAGDLLTTDSDGMLVHPKVVADSPTPLPDGFFIMTANQNPSDVGGEQKIQVAAAGSCVYLRVAAGVRPGQRLVTVPGSFNKFQAAPPGSDPECIIGTVFGLDGDRRVSTEDGTVAVYLGIG